MRNERLINSLLLFVLFPLRMRFRHLAIVLAICLLFPPHPQFFTARPIFLPLAPWRMSLLILFITLLKFFILLLHSHSWMRMPFKTFRSFLHLRAPNLLFNAFIAFLIFAKFDFLVSRLFRLLSFLQAANRKVKHSSKIDPENKLKVISKPY